MNFDQAVVYEAFVGTLTISMAVIVVCIAESGKEVSVAGICGDMVTANSLARLCISYADGSHNGNPINLLCLHKLYADLRGTQWLTETLQRR